MVCFETLTLFTYYIRQTLIKKTGKFCFPWYGPLKLRLLKALDWFKTLQFVSSLRSLCSHPHFPRISHGCPLFMVKSSFSKIEPAEYYQEPFQKRFCIPLKRVQVNELLLVRYRTFLCQERLFVILHAPFRNGCNLWTCSIRGSLKNLCKNYYYILLYIAHKKGEKNLKNHFC